MEGGWRNSGWLADIYANHWLRAEPVGYHIYRLPLVWFAAALAGGIKLADPLPRLQHVDFYRNSQPAIVVGFVAILVLACLAEVWGKRLVAGMLALLCAALLGAWLAIANAPPTGDSLSATAVRETQPIAMRCVVQSTAVWKPNAYYRPQDKSSEPWRTQWDVHCIQVRDGDKWREASAYGSLTAAGRVDDIYPGDHIEVLGTYRKIIGPTNPGAYDFARHFDQDSQFVTFSAETRRHIQIITTSSPYFLPRLRGWLVRQVDGALRRWVAWGQAPLAAALVFGQREQVAWDDQQELMATGTLHMLAISGMHVEIVASVVLFLCAAIAARNRTSSVAVVIVCGIYAALAGGKPPVMRAVMLVAAFALARTMGRRARLANVLAFSAIVLLLLRPANINEVGVHLSFLAVGTMGLFVLHLDSRSQMRSALQSVIEESMGRMHRRAVLAWRASRSVCAMSMWVWLLTCPMIWSNFHVIAPIAIPLNALLAMPLMISLLAGLATGLFGWFPPIAWISGQICGLGLWLIGELVGWGKAVPGGHFWLPAPPQWWTILFYALTISWLFAFGRRKNVGLSLLLFSLIALGVWPHLTGARGLIATDEPSTWKPAILSDTVFQQPTAHDLKCTFLDVGHGTSVIIEFPTGQVWMYDAGRLGVPEQAHQDLALALWSTPTARIERLLLSHADSDHYNATRGLTERFAIGQIASTQQFWDSQDHEVIELSQYLDQRRIPKTKLNASESGALGSVSWKVLHPSSGWSGENDNAASLCLLLEYAGKRILLPGDLEGKGIASLVELPARPCHVLMAPHHGSTTLDPTEMLLWCQPEVIVISGNHRANQQRVVDKYRIVPARLGITFRDGAVQVRIDKSGHLTSWNWREERWLPLP